MSIDIAPAAEDRWYRTFNDAKGVAAVSVYPDPADVNKPFSQGEAHWIAPSRRGEGIYRLTVVKGTNGKLFITCICPGFENLRRCAHVAKLALELDYLGYEIELI